MKAATYERPGRPRSLDDHRSSTPEAGAGECGEGDLVGGQSFGCQIAGGSRSKTLPFRGSFRIVMEPA